MAEVDDEVGAFNSSNILKGRDKVRYAGIYGAMSTSGNNGDVVHFRVVSRTRKHEYIVTNTYTMQGVGGMYPYVFVDLNTGAEYDSNSNGMCDFWEWYYGVSDPNGDPDGDVYTNLQEHQNNTNPLVPDAPFIPTSTPTVTPSMTPTITPTITPTGTPTPTNTRTMTPTPTPTRTPTNTPTMSPTSTPSGTPTSTPTPISPVITNITRNNSSSPAGNITITWDSQIGVAYDVYYANTLAGTYTDVADVTATGSTTAWVDDGSQTGSHPSSVDQRYYKIACYGTSLYSSDTVGEYKVTMYGSGSANSLTSVSLPFVQYATGMSAVFGGQGHTGTPAIPALSDRLNKFNPATEEFDIRFWKSASGWVALGNTEPVTLQADEGFLYTNSLATPQNIWFVGKVSPTNRLLSIRGASGKAQLTYVGSGYPTSVSLGDSNLLGSGFHSSNITGLADLIYEFNLSTGEFDHIAWYKTTTSLWMFINPATSFGFEPGKAYIITNRDNSTPPEWTWDYAKPYSHPPN
ncbi:MAG: hypothetical protein NTZ78_03740 [Candidatus Aureabacteria bacterium]|nr:hypothetical protein [Candidatus Auribacterota bacterium]